MQYALDEHGIKIGAAKGMAGVCPLCRCPVLPKCGRIKVHHWAHVAAEDCDPWSEPETEWHRAWKGRFDPNLVEVPLGPHRADVRTAGGLVVELQNSAISPAEIEAREQFYSRRGDMIWIVNAERFAERFFLMKRMGPDLLAFKWKHMKSSWLHARKPVYLDFGSARVRDLLGEEAPEYCQFFTEGVFQSFVRDRVVRYGAVPEAEADPTLSELPESLLSRTILRIHTIYASGRGSVQPVDTSEFERRLGARSRAV